MQLRSKATKDKGSRGNQTKGMVEKGTIKEGFHQGKIRLRKGEAKERSS